MVDDDGLQGMEFDRTGAWIRIRDIWNVHSGEKLLGRDRLGKLVGLDAETRRCVTIGPDTIKVWRIFQDSGR